MGLNHEICTYHFKDQMRLQRGGKGPLIQENKSATLSTNNDQTLFEPKAYRICGKYSNSMMSDNPNSGCYEAQTGITVDTSTQSPDKNQGGIMVLQQPVSYGIDRAAFNQGQNAQYKPQFDEEISQTVVAKGPNAVGQPICNTGNIAGTLDASYYKGTGTRNGEERCFVGEPYAIGNGQADQTDIHDKVGALNCMHDQQAVMCGFDRYNNSPTGDIAQTLTGNRLNDVPMAQIDYIVRRLTPTECARLQGFPDHWAHNLENPNPTEEDMQFWREVFNTYAELFGKKPKTDNQIKKWLADPHTDSAEYKMWGNGVALPCVFFVMQGIAEELQKDID